MSDLLLELFSEEIPARMQAQAAKDLERIVVGALSDRGLLFEGIKAFAGPRRLTLAIAGLPAKQPDVREEKKGPRVTAPAKALEGFLRSAGVKLEDCEKRDDGKGEFYVAVIELKGRATADVIAELLPECLAKLPWPKSMRWPQTTNAPMRWVRPLYSILCTLDGEVVSFVFAGVTSGNTTRGHRFLSSGEIAVRRFEDYEKKLHDAHVILDAEQRKAIIFENIKQAAFIHGLELIPDEGLLNEVAGLAEWPVVLLGSIEDQFMDVPAEILQTSMRVHQKYFALREPATGKMANRFALVANMVAEDGGKQIVAGNERVLRARLSDAKFFWDQDRKTKLADRVDALKNIVFHAKLANPTVGDKASRISFLSNRVADLVGYPRDIAKQAERAALLAKADLVTGVVGEFPELQGTMGRYYAAQDETVAVSDAIRDHYAPLGPSDHVPEKPVSICVAIADKIDTLGQLWLAGEKPTGSGDPYALRRAALGIIRIVLENKLRLSLEKLIHASQFAYEMRQSGVVGVPKQSELLEFFADRLKIALREKGIRHDLIDAVFSLGNEDDLVRIVARVEALQSFLKTDDGANLLAGYKRAANILRAEEKKDGVSFDKKVDIALLSEPAEKNLAEALGLTKIAIAPSLETEAFAVAMIAMAALRAPVDAFFEHVRVNDDDKVVRANRLNLLGSLRATLHLVADFSKIEG
jgi:glycyl-tRNA synthetase beta chain